MVGEPDATMQPAPQDNYSMSKHRVLSLKPQLRLEWRGQDGQNETEQPDHSASLGDSITASTRMPVRADQVTEHRSQVDDTDLRDAIRNAVEPAAGWFGVLRQGQSSLLMMMCDMTCHEKIFGRAKGRNAANDPHKVLPARGPATRGDQKCLIFSGISFP
jgi:hypothetical protein